MVRKPALLLTILKYIFEYMLSSYIHRVVQFSKTQAAGVPRGWSSETIVFLSLHPWLLEALFTVCPGSHCFCFCV